MRYFSTDTIILTVYVDNIFVTEDDQNIIQLEAYLSYHFHIQDLGHLRYFLGIKVARSPKDLSLSQKKYLTIMDHNIHLDQNLGTRLLILDRIDD